MQPATDDPLAPVDLVVLVASAGGLEAISRVLAALPAGFPVPVVVAQHLGGQGSHLVEILSRRVSLEVAWAAEGAPVRPGLITVCPPRTSLEVLPDRSCALHPIEHVVTDRPLDGLLTSVADSFGAQTLAVVLTGMGTDGSAGARAVHAAGGLVVVQDEETAEHPAMPRAVMDAGAADRVLALHEIGPAVAGLFAGRALPPSRAHVLAARLLFAGPGEVARLARELDWAGTPLGPVPEWPTALRGAVRLALEAPLAMCVLWGPDHVQVYNDAYRDVLGVKHPTGLGRPNRDCWPEVWHLNAGIFAQVLAGDPVSVHDALYPSTRGGVLEDAWFDLVFIPIREDDGGVGGVLCTVVEKTGEVLAARRLRTLHELGNLTAGATTWQGAFEAALTALAADGADIPFAVGYRVVPPRGTRPRAATLVRAVGVAPGSVAAPSAVPLDRGSVWPLAQAMESGEPVLVEDVAGRLGPDPVGGRPAADRALVFPLRDPADSTGGVVVLGVAPRLPFDRTYRDFLWLAARQMSARLAEARAREEERERSRRLAEVDRAKMEFFSNVSHEFRTPLTLILGALDELRATGAGLPESHRGDLEVALRNARRLLRLVGTLLDFSQAEAGRLRARLAPVDLSASTREIASMFRGAAERAGLWLRVDAPPLPEPVPLDVDMWEKVLSNLLSNAVKFTFTGGIDVVVRALPKHVQIEVTDTGVGVPAAELPHLFKRFHRIPDGRARTHEGAGIGLALADELVRRHRGRIRVRSEEGVGTTFTVWLPLGASTERAPARPAPVDGSGTAAILAEEAASWVVDGPAAPPIVDGELPAADRLPATGAADRARILVVDDNRDLRNYLRRLLARYWHVDTAGDGAEALATARRSRPDLVLADVMLPARHGLDLLRAIRADDDLAAVPVVLLTARAGEDATVEGLGAGADGYLTKPFSARELVAVIAGRLELARVRRQSEDRFRALMDASPDVVYRMSPDWTELRVLNGRGFVEDTPDPGRTWLDRYIDPADQPAVREAIRRAVETRSVFLLEHRVRRPDGSLGRTLSRAVPLLDETGEIIEWVGVARAVPERVGTRGVAAR